MTDSDAIAAPLRARVQALAAVGAAPADIRQLCGILPDGQLMSASLFEQTFSRELAQGAAQANIEVSRSLFTQATEGRQSTLLLAWARARLGWGEGSEARHDHDTSDTDSTTALAALQLLLDQLAARKAGGLASAPELAGGSAAQSAPPGQ